MRIGGSYESFLPRSSRFALTLSFPFIKERLAAGWLSLHGAYFDVATGALQAFDTASGAFEPVT